MPGESLPPTRWRADLARDRSNARSDAERSALSQPARADRARAGCPLNRVAGSVSGRHGPLSVGVLIIAWAPPPERSRQALMHSAMFCAVYAPVEVRFGLKPQIAEISNLGCATARSTGRVLLIDADM